MQQIKGTILKSRLGFVEQHWGRDGVERVLGSLPDEDQKTLRTLLSVKWYPFEIGQRLDAAIVQVMANGDRGVFERLGAASAEANLGSVHKQFLTPGKPHVFLGKAQLIYGFYYETGRRTYQQTGERAGVLTTHDAETFSVPDCLTVAGWYRRALELCGARGVSIVEDECRATGGEVCRYRFEWADVAG